MVFRFIRNDRAAQALVLLLPLLLVAGFLSGCKPLPPSKPAAEFTPLEARGALVFQANCARCHNPTTTKGKKGPGLQALTKLKSMPSGAPPNDDRLSETILHGRGMMPAAPLDNEELQALLAYLHTL
jgi:mono/diheme cytochrome c family protein